MNAIAIREPGDESVLVPESRPMPAPGVGEVLVRVAAAGVNRPDILQRRGLYPPPPGASDIPGLEIAGEVVAIGPAVEDVRVGDRVCALVTGGGYADHCLAAAALCLPIPDGLSLVEAAGLPEAVFTVWANLIERGRLRAGDTVLIQGGAGGIGTMAIQIARLRGARVIATAGSTEKCAACVALGAQAIPYREADFADRVKTLTDGRGVDVILDIIGGAYLARHLDILAPGGRLVVIALQGGANTEINLATLMTRHLTLTGSTLRPRSLAEKARLARVIRAEVWPLIDTGAIRPVIHATFPLHRAGQAHALMASGRHIGKIILTRVPTA